MSYKIRKSSGYTEFFDEKKFRRSLKRAGADDKTANEVMRIISEEKPKTTKQVHERAVELLAKIKPPLAARYNLKQALMELGPAGFPFEQFVARIFQAQGYKIQTNEIVAGYCVDHEVDIIATKGDSHFMIECKFHNRPALKSDVKVALYVNARFEDVRKAWEAEHKGRHQFHQAWVVTNTHFTSEAIKYGECRNVKMISWSYPLGENLARMIDRLGLHPITALTSLSSKQKRQLVKNGFVLCKDAEAHADELKKLGFSSAKIRQIISEMNQTCELK